MPSSDPIIAIVGNIKTDPRAASAAETLGRELAKAGFRLLVYASGADYLEGPVVRGFVASRAAGRQSIQVRYPLHGDKPSFPEQETNSEMFDWRPDRGQDWEISFYQSLNDVDGILLMGGGDSTLIAGLVAMGRGMAIVAVAGFGGKAAQVWDVIKPERDLPSADEKSLMATPGWSEPQAAECAKAMHAQIARKMEQENLRVVEERRRETLVTMHACFAALLFLLAVASVPVAWSERLPPRIAIWLLFLSPLLAGVSGSTIRLVFDLRQGAVPLTSQSAITTAALGLIAGGVAGMLFITAQITASPASLKEIVSAEQASRLVPFGVLVGFIAGLTLDAVFRKLITSEVVESPKFTSGKRF